jgi:hypothetical protein
MLRQLLQLQQLQLLLLLLRCGDYARIKQVAVSTASALLGS